MRFAREGVPFVLASGAGAILLNVLGGWWAGLVGLGFTLYIASFFRDPEREIPDAAEVVVSPADGRIIAIEEKQAAGPMPGEEFRRLSIFMSPLNVHVNRIPLSGEVVAVRRFPGRFGAAYGPLASTENERTEVAMRDPKGRPVVFVQVAGWLARRIICRLRPGQRVERGERFGLIMFGSRVDVYLPPAARVEVKVGQRVRAGSDVLATLTETT